MQPATDPDNLQKQMALLMRISTAFKIVQNIAVVFQWVALLTWPYYLTGLFFKSIRIPFWKALAISAGFYFVRKIMLFLLYVISANRAGAAWRQSKASSRIPPTPITPDEEKALSSWDVGDFWQCPQCDFSCHKHEREAQMDHLNRHAGAD